MLVTQGKETIVQSIHFAHLGITLRYRAPKMRAQLIGQSNLKQQLPVAFGGG
jgi:hypothetical protein